MTSNRTPSPLPEGDAPLPPKPKAQPIPEMMPPRPEPTQHSYVSRIITHVPTIIDTVSAASDFFMGESMTESERIRRAQHDVERESRRTEGRAWMAEQGATRSRQRVDAMMKSPITQEKMASGAGDPGLRREISRAKRLEDRSARLDAAATRQADAADSLTDTQATISSLESAGTITEALETAVYAINQDEGNTMADRLREAELSLKEAQRSTDRAMGNKSATQRNASVDVEYARLQEQARLSLMKSSATRGVAHQTGRSVQPTRLNQTPVVLSSSTHNSIIAKNGESALSSNGGREREGGEEEATGRSSNDDEVLMRRLEQLKFKS